MEDVRTRSGKAGAGREAGVESVQHVQGTGLEGLEYGGVSERSSVVSRGGVGS